MAERPIPSIVSYLAAGRNHEASLLLLGAGAAATAACTFVRFLKLAGTRKRRESKSEEYVSFGGTYLLGLLLAVLQGEVPPGSESLADVLNR